MTGQPGRFLLAASSMSSASDRPSRVLGTRLCNCPVMQSSVTPVQENQHGAAISTLSIVLQPLSMRRLEAATSENCPFSHGTFLTHPAMSDRAITIAVELAQLFSDDALPVEVEAYTL